MRSGTVCGILFSIGVLTGALAAVAADVKNEDCLGCHGMEGIEGVTARGKTLKLFVDAKALLGSAHEDFVCTDCHTGARDWANAPHAVGPLTLGCANCHTDVAELYRTKDIHGRGYAEKDPRAPSCNGCHAGHRILPLSSPESAMSRQNQADTCGKCHGSEELNREEGITKRNLIERYKTSVHWNAIQMGKPGAVCTDCHGFHTILPSSAFDSTVSRNGIVQVCAKCHPNETKTYRDGAHGRTLAHGNNDVPTCTTCHGDHDMASLRARTGDAKSWAATQVCIWCHGNERIMARYGLDTDPVESYLHDFHGLTQRGTMGASATCADCHEAHHALPASHPQSRMNISNRGAACGTCHGKVSQSFAMQFSHKRAMQYTGAKIENIVRILYILIIVGTVLGMLVHNGIQWVWAVRRKHAEQRLQKHIRRMTRFELTCHWILFLSFCTLAVTGFALKFPEVFWVKWLFSVGMTEAVRAFIHRTAAVTMSFDFFLFLSYMVLRRRGKRILKEMLPLKGDITEFFATMKFYLGLNPVRPRHAVFNYAEKFEFWALVWGTLIMAVTGFILWFPKTLPSSWPSWIMTVSRIIHYYEALLATLAILIWHGWHTIFHPDEYPMSTTWLTGYITEEEATHKYNDAALETMMRHRDAAGSPANEENGAKP
jgi:cytochrome b subunit of formate dehydrogenase